MQFKIDPVQIFIEMHGYFNDNLPSFFQNRTKSYKLERILKKTLESFPSAMFPKA